MNRLEEAPILMEGSCRVNLPCDSVGFRFNNRFLAEREAIHPSLPVNLAPSGAFC